MVLNRFGLLVLGLKLSPDSIQITHVFVLTLTFKACMAAAADAAPLHAFVVLSSAITAVVGTPDYPSGIPDMHTIHDPMISMS
jgi:hypothetical protein